MLKLKRSKKTVLNKPMASRFFGKFGKSPKKRGADNPPLFV
jgi:hypothetical protein